MAGEKLVAVSLRR